MKEYIYLLSNGHSIILGNSTDPENKVKQLQRWEGELEIITIIEGTQDKELDLHSILKETGSHFNCEWYPAYRKHEILNLLCLEQELLNEEFLEIFGDGKKQAITTKIIP